MKQCEECGKVVLGRSDRKYCSEACRVASNNRKYRENTILIKKVNRILIKNHRILDEISKQNKGICTFKLLVEKGFNFDYITSLDYNINYKREKSNPFIVGCYDLYYKINKDDTISIIDRGYSTVTDFAKFRG